MSERKAKGRPWLRWLVYAVILTALVSTTTLSRYLTNISGSGTATIAAVEMQTSSLSFRANAMIPGDIKTFGFDVVNFDGPRGSDVSLSYSITLETTGNLPLTYTLITEDETATDHALSLVVDGATEEPQEDGSRVWTWSGGNLPHDADTTHSYTLTATWPITANPLSNDPTNPDYSDEIDTIAITVEAQQADPSI